MISRYPVSLWAAMEMKQERSAVGMNEDRERKRSFRSCALTIHPFVEHEKFRKMEQSYVMHQREEKKETKRKKGKPSRQRTKRRWIRRSSC